MYIENQQQPYVFQEFYPALNSFFEKFELNECEAGVWDLTTAYFSQPDNFQWTQITRANIVYFCANLSSLLKGLHHIWKSGHREPVIENSEKDEAIDF